jgi:MFS family permease
MFVNSYGVLVLLRILLGIAEAGFFPGVLLYLTYWFTPTERAAKIAVFYSAQVVSGIVGGIAQLFFSSRSSFLNTFSSLFLQVLDLISSCRWAG